VLKGEITMLRKIHLRILVSLLFLSASAAAATENLGKTEV
jgi:hypothetical protein